LDVKLFGARGDGTANDAPAIQAAINAAALTGGYYSGGQVYLPSGEYLVEAPLILPRTGSTPTKVVHLIGENTRTSRIVGGRTFPTGRSVVEWEEAPGVKAWHQEIRSLTIKAPPVLNTGCVHYRWLRRGETFANADAELVALYSERLQIRLQSALFEGSNNYNPFACKLEGNLIACSFQDVALDPSLGNGTYETCLLEFDSKLLGADTNDAYGVGYSHFSNLQTTLRRGGWAQLVKGRLNRVQINTMVSGNGSRSVPVIDLSNSVAATITNFFTEGRGGQPQIRMSDCRGMVMESYTLGTPSDAGSGIGNGMGLYNVRDSVFRNRIAGSRAPSFAAKGVKVVTLDAACRNNRFEGFHTTGPLVGEITDLGADNSFEGYQINLTPNLFHSAGIRRSGDINATGGYRQTLDGWRAMAPPAGATTRLSRWDGSAFDLWTAPRAGSITAISARATAARTTGRCAVQILKNGVVVPLFVVLDAVNPQKAVTLKEKDAVTFAQGDDLYLQVQTSADFAPVTADVWAALEIET
jgi:hypothetical protein